MCVSLILSLTPIIVVQEVKDFYVTNANPVDSFPRSCGESVTSWTLWTLTSWKLSNATLLPPFLAVVAKP